MDPLDDLVGHIVGEICDQSRPLSLHRIWLRLLDDQDLTLTLLAPFSRHCIVGIAAAYSIITITIAIILLLVMMMRSLESHHTTRITN